MQQIPLKQKHTSSSMPIIDFGMASKVKIIRSEEYRARILWLIQLRWVAIVALCIGLPLGQIFMDICLLTVPLIVLTFILIVYNTYFYFLVKQLQNKPDDRTLNIIANTQISIDLFLLALFLYFSGGIQNPFVFYFVFHMIIGAIMLTARAAYLQAVWASALVGISLVLYYFNILPHHCLKNFLSFSLYADAKYVWTFYLVFVSTLFSAVYMTYSISKELRTREERLIQQNLLLQEQDRLKSQYVLMISHDLQQPLSAIQSNLRVILDGYTGSVSDEIGDLIRRAERRTAQLIVLIKDLLMVSSIRSYKELPKERFDLKPLAVDVLNQVEPTATGKQINLRHHFPDLDIPICGNRDVLRHVIMNLLENAIKYTPQGGNVTFQLNLANDKKLEGFIEDSGIGIAREDFDKIFAEFYRGKNAIEAEKDGTGLGLCVVKLGLEQHGGTVKVISPALTDQNGKGVGTRFQFTLPLCTNENGEKNG
ncbi:HAMP domain-containing histidine kinase [candidate division KSB1 bacterium]|nr:HAMP domain-containing histidine kinase [candidate division KSB1 bacterium]